MARANEEVIFEFQKFMDSFDFQWFFGSCLMKPNIQNLNCGSFLRVNLKDILKNAHLLGLTQQKAVRYNEITNQKGRERMSEKVSFQEIVDCFMETKSVQRTAAELNTNTTRVRRVLITEGLWHSSLSDKIGNLHSQGNAAEEIAAQLFLSPKTVQCYLPYTRGSYIDNQQSSDAVKSQSYRERKKNAAQRQVAVVKKQYSKEASNMEIPNGERVFSLHLELDTPELSNEDVFILRKYGKATNGIARDILVSENMNLRALHYAIQRAFGWQNSHLHHFTLPKDALQLLTAEKLPEWSKLCGVYFRFPDAPAEDIYWDSDYTGEQSIRTWLRHKYSAPYSYHGDSEHFLIAQWNARQFMNQKVIEMPPYYQQLNKMNQGALSLCEASLEQVRFLFESEPAELLERVRVGDILFPKADTAPSPEKIVALKEEAAKRFESTDFSKLQTSALDDEELHEFFYQYEDLLRKVDVSPLPITSQLKYEYDYGDGWEVTITCTDVFFSLADWNDPAFNGFVVMPVTEKSVMERQTIVDRQGHPVQGELRDLVASVIAKCRPVCTWLSGLNVMDDVGGVFGYCDFLQTIHGSDEEEKHSMLLWAKSMGWNGRMSKPSNIL